MQLQENVPLAPYTNINLGGPARFFAHCTSVDDILAALQVAEEKSLKIHILAGGTNTVFPDKGFDGLVLFIDLKGKTFEESSDTVTFRLAAGEAWDPFVAEATKQGLWGIECLSGIPGSVGATPVQNVGAYGQEVSQTITNVTALDRTTKQLVNFLPADCQFGYRTSRFKTADADTYIITEVTFSLQKQGEPNLSYEQLQIAYTERAGTKKLSPLEQLQLIRESVIALRTKKSMIVRPEDPHSRSCGSFFMNPILSRMEFVALKEKVVTLDITDPIPQFPFGDHIDVPAAWLIEKAGLNKGLRHKGVGISANHPLALVNYGGTTAELLELAAIIQDKVERIFGIRLVPEPIIVR